MAPSRAGQTIAAGSAPWIVQERRRAMEAVMSEAQDFSFSVCRELEWLNEHMGSIFKPNLDINTTFKTPARIRGKTPKTIRRNPASAKRTPLSDIFAPNLTQSPARTIFNQKPIALPPTEDNENNENASPTVKASAKGAEEGPSSMVQDTIRPTYKDSGYHGMTDDEMEASQGQESNAMSKAQFAPTSDSQATTVADDTIRVSHDSFVSAKEDITSRMTSVEPSHEITRAAESSSKQNPPLPSQPSKETNSIAEEAEDRLDLDDLQSLSDGPSPAKVLPRKSSLTFSSLPAREPLGKSSIGPRASHADMSKSFGPSIAQLGRNSSMRASAAPVSASFPVPAHAVASTASEVAQTTDSNSSEALKLHNKTSTQRLHDRINMLGQSREIRPSKSFHTSSDKLLYPSLPTETSATVNDQSDQILQKTKEPLKSPLLDDDDDWIAPLAKAATVTGVDDASQLSQPQRQQSKIVEDVANRLAGIPQTDNMGRSPRRPFMHQKMLSTTLLPSPTKAAMAPPAQKPISVSNPPDLSTKPSSTTPPETPPRSPSGRKILDGPISASKAKLNSLLKSAKGIFASSAGASAQAKLETLSTTRAFNQDVVPAISSKLDVAIGETRVGEEYEGRRTRSSTEHDRKRKAGEQQKASDQLEKIRDRERQRAAAAAAAKMNRAVPASKVVKQKVGETTEKESQHGSDDIFLDANDDMPPPPPPKSMLPTTNARMNQQVRRVPVPRPTQEVSRTKPAPVIIRMPSQRLDQPAQSSTASSSAVRDSVPPPPPPKSNAMSKTGGASSQLSSSTSSTKSINPSAKRALEVAAKKKEQEAKIAQQKAEKKRDLEQKRAQRIEEERKRDEQRKAAEQQKMQEARKAAQRQAEVRRLEMQRREAPRPESRQAQPSSTQHMVRSDVNQARPIAKMNVVHNANRPVIQVNPVKPPKRALPAEEASNREERPVPQRNPPSYQQLDAKRRKTDEQEAADARGSVMAPPVRQSAVKKDVGKYTNGYTSTHTTPHHNHSMLIKTVTAQHQQQHHQQQQLHKSVQQSEMTKYASGRIPFAEASAQQVSQVSQQTIQYKTPARPNPAATLSPYYTPGENIELPDIPSDSEDEDSDNEFLAPSWTESPALREALRSQQLVDPESIFGPIGALNMEEVFRDNKDRLKKFRKRTSSANWNGIDRLTDSERKRDRDARVRMEADGGWDFQSQRAAMSRKSPKPL